MANWMGLSWGFQSHIYFSNGPGKLWRLPGGYLLFISFGRHVHFLGCTPLRDHSPPQTPLQCPHQTKKGTNLLHYEFCIHQDLKLKCCRVIGQKLRHGRPCTTWPNRQPQLACTAPYCFHYFRIPLTISCWHNFRSLEWIPAPLVWLTPRPALKRVCFWLLGMSTYPPFTQSAQKGWQSTGLELRILMMCLKFRGSGPEKNCSPSPK